MSLFQDLTHNVTQEELATSLSRVFDHTRNRSIGMISADRSEITDPKIRDARRAELRYLVKQSPWGYIPNRGNTVENQGTPQERHVEEDSLLVIGPHKNDDPSKHRTFQKDLETWGQHFDQDAVGHKHANDTEANLIGTTKRPGIEPKLGEKQSIGTWHPNKLGMFYTELRRSNQSNKPKPATIPKPVAPKPATQSASPKPTTLPKPAKPQKTKSDSSRTFAFEPAAFYTEKSFFSRKELLFWKSPPDKFNS